MTSYSARALYQHHYHDFAQALDLIWCQTQEGYIFYRSNVERHHPNTFFSRVYYIWTE
jgi:hypothetical protein